jgi:hypothetical protein
MITAVEYLHTVLNPEDNSGESVQLDAEVYDNGDDENNVFAVGFVNLQSYGRSATINIGDITPQAFRDFADKLEKAMARHKRG